MSATPLTAEAEALVQAITPAGVRAAESGMADIVRTVLSQKDRDVFGPTERTVRDRIHKAAVQAYAAVLARTKTAPRAPASPVPTAGRPLATTATGSAIR